MTSSTSPLSSHRPPPNLFMLHLLPLLYTVHPPPPTISPPLDLFFSHSLLSYSLSSHRALPLLLLFPPHVFPLLPSPPPLLSSLTFSSHSSFLTSSFTSLHSPNPYFSHSFSFFPILPYILPPSPPFLSTFSFSSHFSFLISFFPSPRSSSLLLSLLLPILTWVFPLSPSHLLLLSSFPFFSSHSLLPPLQASALKVSTPLTGRKYIQNAVSASPLSSAMKSVGRLHTLLSGTQQEPSAKLKEVLRYEHREGHFLSHNLATSFFLTFGLFRMSTGQRSNVFAAVAISMQDLHQRPQ